MRTLLFAFGILCFTLQTSQAQHFRIASWDMTYDQVSQAEEVPLERTGYRASGKGIAFLDDTFNVKYEIAQDEILKEEIYTKLFSNDEERDSVYEKLMAHLQESFGVPHSEDSPQWTHDDAIIYVDRTPRFLTIKIANPESYDDRVARRNARASDEEIAAISDSEHAIRLKACNAADLDGNNSRDVQILWDYYGSKTIKFIYFTVAPFDAEGKTQRCTVGGHSVYRAEMMGPFKHSKITNDLSWQDVWTNDNISCVKLAKVEVEYVDGTSYTYVTELPEIQWESFSNGCMPTKS